MTRKLTILIFFIAELRIMVLDIFVLLTGRKMRMEWCMSFRSLCRVLKRQMLSLFHETSLVKWLDRTDMFYPSLILKIVNAFSLNGCHSFQKLLMKRFWVVCWSSCLHTKYGLRHNEIVSVNWKITKLLLKMLMLVRRITKEWNIMWWNSCLTQLRWKHLEPWMQRCLCNCGTTRKKIKKRLEMKNLFWISISTERLQTTYSPKLNMQLGDHSSWRLFFWILMAYLRVKVMSLGQNAMNWSI